jgi:CRP-like cAMP-binding protein
MNTEEGMILGRYSPTELNEVFSFLSAAEMGELLAYLEFREWQPGEVVMQRGDPGAWLGFLVEGKLAVKMEAIFPGKFILVAVLERGSLVGEVAAVEGGERNATVIATDKSHLLILSNENMETMLRQAPALGLKLLRWIIHVLGHRLGKASDRLARLL